MVPGGQNLYVNTDGQILFTVQHSHSIPSTAYWNYMGWTWTAQPTDEQKAPLANCDTTDERFNCAAPTGYWTFAAPDAAPGVGGAVACPNVADPAKWNAYAITPQFAHTDCINLTGLGTHQYTGENPPVWGYYN
ncbi:uncharacterized protein K452DRAFT_290431 [Aplosporella prunicola CBS 121167]|uniref:Uncharacterized protein n=1 Tax=Aplosporella prunicola CBS 121167 TaxID=1176127 RepID=A0A6A6B5T2_9PEZI|nr:uncharacterized protein K452DRAFT_290431 [Aplosporella prunicola CBS 121167]KAF2138783.1 hypothetical protein K452DRAFT_290431 [Aplosporella prunicola CBS 121167]